MTTYTYKNVSSVTQMLLGVGEVKPGETVTTTFRVENPNFKIVETNPRGKAKVKQERN